MSQVARKKNGKHPPPGLAVAIDILFAHIEGFIILYGLTNTYEQKVIC